MKAETLNRYRLVALSGDGEVDRFDLIEFLTAYVERDLYLSLLKEIATAKTLEVTADDPEGHLMPDHKHGPRRDKAIRYKLTVGLVQRHVRQKFEEWGIKMERSGE